MNTSQFSPEKFFDLSSCNYKDLFVDIVNIWEVLPKLEKYIESKKLHANYGGGTIIEETAVIQGPVVIGKNCYIGPAAFLRGPVLLGDNVHVGHSSEIKHAVVLNNSAIAHLNYVGDSVIGSSVNIGGGAMFANLRFDNKTVTIRTEEGKISTSLQKFSAIVGDNSHIGVNCVINPGTVLGKNTIVYPMTSVLGAHKENEVIK